MRNYQRLTKVAVLRVEPVTDPATGQPVVDEEGNYVYPRSRDYTRDEATYPSVCRDVRVVQRSKSVDTLYYVLAGDPTFMKLDLQRHLLCLGCHPVAN